MNIYTIGHSTHNIEDFVLMLQSQQIEILIDIRSYAGSHYVSHFNQEQMKIWLLQNGIQYLHMPELGGRRRKLKDIDESLIDGWTHVSFRNYAAYTLTQHYKDGIKRLIKIAENNKVCYMCSECVPWKCHRSIISNTLTSMGIRVWHIMKNKIDKHELGKYGAIPVVNETSITYPKNTEQMELQFV